MTSSASPELIVGLTDVESLPAGAVGVTVSADASRDREDKPLLAANAIASTAPVVSLPPPSPVAKGAPRSSTPTSQAPTAMAVNPERDEMQRLRAVFNDAQRNIFQLLEADVLPRYLRSRLFRIFCDTRDA